MRDNIKQIEEDMLSQIQSVLEDGKDRTAEITGYGFGFGDNDFTVTISVKKWKIMDEDDLNILRHASLAISKNPDIHSVEDLLNLDDEKAIAFEEEADVTLGEIEGHLEDSDIRQLWDRFISETRSIEHDIQKGDDKSIMPRLARLQRFLVTGLGFDDEKPKEKTKKIPSPFHTSKGLKKGN